ncbi:MAG: DUF2442 domain-containing protein [Gammaproteobacteria bacterium]
MIKIVNAQYLGNKVIRLRFSDHSWGDYDLQSLIARQTELVLPLENEDYVSQFFLELGALCWKNGLEFSAGSLHRKLQERGGLHVESEVA